MKWVTRDFVHFDRVACIWLIKRHVDPDAAVSFVPWGAEDQRASDAIPFGIPGVELGPHDATGTTFSKFLSKYHLEDVALQEIGQVVDAGVRFVLHGYKPDKDDVLGQVAVGMLAISEGFLLLHESDQGVVDACLPMYDALYQKRRAASLVRATDARVPASGGRGPTLPTLFLRQILKDHPPAPARVKRS
jgi:hypothetical protein